MTAVVDGWSFGRLLDGAHLRRLRSLSLSDNRVQLSGGAAERLGGALRGARTLQELDLSVNPISDAAAADLCATLLRQDGTREVERAHMRKVRPEEGALL